MEFDLFYGIIITLDGEVEEKNDDNLSCGRMLLGRTEVL